MEQNKAVTETPGAAALCIVKQGPDQGPMVLIQTQDTNELIASVAAVAITAAVASYNVGQPVANERRAKS